MGSTCPLSELQFAYSPYSYVYGNPIRFNDPTEMIGECDKCPKEIEPNKQGGVNNPIQIEEVVITRTKPSLLSFMGISNMNAFHNSQDRLASAAISFAMYYETAAEQSASIFKSIAHGHMFMDGNKRTAIAVFEKLAKEAGLQTVNRNEMLNVATQVAEGKITDVSEIAKLLTK